MRWSNTTKGYSDNSRLNKKILITAFFAPIPLIRRNHIVQQLKTCEATSPETAKTLFEAGASAANDKNLFLFHNYALSLFLLHNSLRMCLISARIWLYIILRLYIGANTMWYLHSLFVCAKLFLSIRTPLLLPFCAVGEPVRIVMGVTMMSVRK